MPTWKLENFPLFSRVLMAFWVCWQWNNLISFVLYISICILFLHFFLKLETLTTIVSVPTCLFRKHWIYLFFCNSNNNNNKIWHSLQILRSCCYSSSLYALWCWTYTRNLDLSIFGFMLGFWTIPTANMTNTRSQIYTNMMVGEQGIQLFEIVIIVL